MRYRGWFVRFAPAAFGAAIVVLAVLCGQKPQPGYSGAGQPAIDSSKMTNKTVAMNMPMGMADTAVSAAQKDTAAKGNEADYYTCPMHPQIHAAKPGKCPICGMDLVFTKVTSAGKVSPVAEKKR